MPNTYPQILAGMSLTSALLAAMLPLNAYKSGDQSVTSSTTLVNDSALVLPLAANAKYEFSLTVIYTGGTNGSSDAKFAWVVPSGATMTYQWLISNLSNATQAGEGAQGTTLLCGSAGSTVQAMSQRGTIATSSTQANLQLQFAQNTSNATSTTVKAGSILVARRVA